MKVSKAHAVRHRAYNCYCYNITNISLSNVLTLVGFIHPLVFARGCRHDGCAVRGVPTDHAVSDSGGAEKRKTEAKVAKKETRKETKRKPTRRHEQLTTTAQQNRLKTVSTEKCLVCAYRNVGGHR